MNLSKVLKMDALPVIKNTLNLQFSGG